METCCQLAIRKRPSDQAGLSMFSYGGTGGIRTHDDPCGYRIKSPGSSASRLTVPSLLFEGFNVPAPNPTTELGETLDLTALHTIFPFNCVMEGPLGIKPRLPEPNSGVLSLHHEPVDADSNRYPAADGWYHS